MIKRLRSWVVGFFGLGQMAARMDKIEMVQAQHQEVLRLLLKRARYSVVMEDGRMKLVRHKTRNRTT